MTPAQPVWYQCMYCGMWVAPGFAHSCVPAPFTLGHSSYTPYPPRPCEHCFCKTETRLGKPHVKCCMCGVVRLQEAKP